MGETSTETVSSELTSHDTWFIRFKVIFLIAYACVVTLIAWGFSGFVTEYIIYVGIEYVKVSTFGTMVMGIVAFVGLMWLERRIDKLFAKLFGVGKK